MITNIGETQITGLELGVAARLTDNLDLNFSWGWSDAEIQKGCDFEWGQFVGNDPVACPPANYPNGAASTAGNRTGNSPEHTGALRLDYRNLTATGREWFIGADWLYESTRYAQIFNLAETGDSNIINLRGGLEGENWKLTMWIKNVGDDDAANAIVRLIDFDTIFTGIQRAFQVGLPRGRQAGVSYEYRFGAL